MSITYDNNNPIIDKLKDIICEINITIEKDDIPVNTGLLSSDILDSFGFVELVDAISEQFQIEIVEEDINSENFKNLTEIACFIRTKRVKKGTLFIDLRSNFEIDDLYLKNFVSLSDEEKKQVLEWRNHDDVRNWMYNNKIISTEEHFNYVEQLKNDVSNSHWLVKTNRNDFIGVGCFHKIDYNDKNAEMEIYFNPDSEQKNIGFKIGSALVKILFEKARFKTILAEVIEDNKRIIYLLFYLGFKEKKLLKDITLNNGVRKNVLILELQNTQL